MPALTKDQILAADDLGVLKLTVPEWGGDVYIRVMSVGERDFYLSRNVHRHAAFLHAVRPSHRAPSRYVVPQNHLQAKGDRQLPQDVIRAPARLSRDAC